MLPIVICEESVRLFKFYYDDSIRQGMCRGSQLYALLQIFDAKQRSLAYELGCRLANRGHEVAITVSSQDYKVWVEVRSSVNLKSLLVASSDDLASAPGDEFSARLSECAC